MDYPMFTGKNPSYFLYKVLPDIWWVPNPNKWASENTVRTWSGPFPALRLRESNWSLVRIMVLPIMECVEELTVHIFYFHNEITHICDEWKKRGGSFAFHRGKKTVKPEGKPMTEKKRKTFVKK
jgi:hypothetical protein